MASSKQKIRELFDQAVELDPAARAGFLEALDPELRPYLEKLLASHERDQVFFDVPLVAAPRLEGQAPDLSGEVLGAWRLTTALGRGGMGTVYAAERCDGAYQQEAAVKLLGLASLNPALASAFQKERQILARLQHPNIAALLDGGCSERSLLYLVMERIDGERIDEYVKSRQLSVAAILELFLQALEAVQFAHNSLIVHRDLKPSNIMVSRRGELKLLDFGIAKTLDDAESNEQGEYTLAGHMTPRYASPEQLSGKPVSTSTDIYSLAVVLYELVTGRLPYNARSTSLPDLIEAVNEVPALAPRRANPHIHRDLELILLKALQKDPSRRYPSASHFADDVRRYLRREPVSARPDSLAYRVERFVVRNSALSGLGLLLVLVTAIGIYFTVSEGLRAQRRFNEVRSLATSLLFELDPTLATIPQTAPARKKITELGLSYLDRISKESSIDFALGLELAQGYQKLGDILGSPGTPNLGMRQESLDAQKRAIQIAEKLLREQPGNTAVQSLLGLSCARAGSLYQRRGDRQQARVYLERAIGLLSAKQGAPFTIAHYYLSDLETVEGHSQEAIRIIERALPAAVGENRLAVMGLANNLANAYSERGESQSGLRRLKELEPRIWALMQEEAYRRAYSGTAVNFYLDMADFIGDPRRPNEMQPCTAVPFLQKARSLLGPAKALAGQRDANINRAETWVKLGLAFSRCPQDPSARASLELIDTGMDLIGSVTKIMPAPFVLKKAEALMNLGRGQESLQLLETVAGWQEDPFALYTRAALRAGEARSLREDAWKRLAKEKDLDIEAKYLLLLVAAGFEPGHKWAAADLQLIRQTLKSMSMESASLQALGKKLASGALARRQ